jgi:hypothetical protein
MFGALVLLAAGWLWYADWVPFPGPQCATETGDQVVAAGLPMLTAGMVLCSWW